MAKIIVTSDSTCAMPRDIASSIGLNILPLNVIVNGVEYHDGIDIDLNKLCLMMREGADIKTSTPTPYEIESFFDGVFAKGADHIIHFTISHCLSSMFDLFTNICKEKYGNKVTVIDSLNVCSAMLQLVFTAKKMAEEGYSVNEIVDEIELRKSEQLPIFFIPETLTYLKRGGRISPAVAAIGNFIGMKPVLSVKNGSLDKETTTRNIKKTLSERVDQIVLMKLDPSIYQIDILQCDTNDSLLQWLKEVVKNKLPEFVCEISNLSINVCAHAGPGTIGIAINKKVGLPK